MSDYRWLNKNSRDFLAKDYLLEGQTVEERIDIICKTAFPDAVLWERFKENVKKGWYSFSSPIWANFGTDRGLPISCFGSYIGDSMEDILTTQAEVGMMTKFGGGTSAFFGDLRPRGAPIKNNGESHGSVHFMQLFDNIINVVSQGKVRRGNFAAYLPVEHDDIEEFLTIRSEGSPIQDLSFGVTISDAWMQAMIDGDRKKRKIWAKILEMRANVGYPYIVFIDNMNNQAPDVYRQRGMKIRASNLCTEIALVSDEDNSFVCDLSSMNLAYFDEWKDTDAVALMVVFLDKVMTEFIEKAKKIPYLQRAVHFAETQRALGIGVLGWHTLLQKKMIPFESEEARKLNDEIWANMYEHGNKMTRELAKFEGEPKLLKGYGRKNVTLFAIAPTKSSSFILGGGNLSEGIEPIASNYYIRDLAKGKFTVKNKYLEKLLKKKDQNTDQVWDSILLNSGSVQHLNFLDDHEKNVFKTFSEIDPKEIIQQAADRQKYIDQAQSINLTITPDMPAKKVSELYISAWKMGIKSLYYQISVNAAQELTKNLLTQNQCVACEL